jgi:hypothetical protein
MDRRRFVSLAFAGLSCLAPALAQPAGKIVRIAYLSAYSAEIDKALIAAFRN